MNEEASSFGPHLKIILICHYLNLLKEEKKKHNYTTHKVNLKAYLVQQTKHKLRENVSRHVNFRVSRNWMGPLNDDKRLQVDEKINKN